MFKHFIQKIKKKLWIFQHLPFREALFKERLSILKGADQANRHFLMALCTYSSILAYFLIFLFNRYMGQWKLNKRNGKGIQEWPDDTK